MRKILLMAVSCCLVWPSPAFCWWETGHQVTARVAAAHLTPAARTRVARILGVPENPEAVADALAHASTWADETKGETKTGEWHYIDLALQDSKSDIPARCKDNNCAPARISLFAAQLSSRTTEASRRTDGRWSELEALRFLVHFVGDIHQPLHTISDADLGGNCELLDPPYNEAKNLHALWDGGIVRSLDLDERSLAADLESQIQTLGASKAVELARGNPDDWTWESHELAKKNVYGRLHVPLEPVIFPHSCGDAPASITGFKPVIDSLYINDMKPIVRDQLIKAGLRLARLLNESL